MSKVRIVPTNKHGGSIFVTTTELAQELDWEPEDEVRIQMSGNMLIITLQGVT